MTARPVARHATIAAIALATVPANLALGVDWRLAISAGVAVLFFGELLPRLLPERRAVAEARPSGAYPLTRREVEVGILGSQGMTNKEIATQIHRSINTVERHFENIYNKLDISSRAELAVWMMERGLLPDANSRKESASAEHEARGGGRIKPPPRP